MSTTKSRKVCFVASPIGLKEADLFYKFIVREGLEKSHYKFEVIRADEILQGGSITDQVLEYLKTSDLVIADLSGLNPNVFYEVGYRHHTGKPIIHFINDLNSIPFNVRAFRTIGYQLDLVGVSEAALVLSRFVDNTFANE